MKSIELKNLSQDTDSLIQKFLKEFEKSQPHKVMVLKNGEIEERYPLVFTIDSEGLFLVKDPYGQDETSEIILIKSGRYTKEDGLVGLITNQDDVIDSLFSLLKFYSEMENPELYNKANMAIFIFNYLSRLTYDEDDSEVEVIFEPEYEEDNVDGDLDENSSVYIECKSDIQ